MKDVQCPYCDAPQDIDHDDGYGYDESGTYEQECSECGKIFVYNTFIMFSYEVSQAPCKNDGEHSLKEIIGCPKEFFEFMRRCEYCGEEICIDKEAHEANLKKYQDTLFNV